jgi:ABC-type branched-subunit amino acid transport system ATPase component
MAKFYIDSGNVSFVVCANDAEGAALWAMHRTIDDKVCLYEDEAQVRAQLVEDAMLFDESLRDNILLGRTDVSAARLTEVADAAHVTEFLPQLSAGLDSPAGPRGSALSGGQRQFLAVAMALIAEPSLLLLDEPSAGLSPKASEEVLGVMRNIAQTGVAILMVEQNVKAALTLSDRAYVFADGQKQYEGLAPALLNDPILGEIYLGKTHVAKPV